MARVYRWIALAAVAAGAAVLGWSAVYRNDDWNGPAAPAPPESAREQLLHQLEARPPRRDVDTSAAASALAAFRAERLTVVPRTSPAEHIAVAGARVGRLESDRLVVSEPGTTSPSLSLALPGAELIAPAAGGGLLAIGKEQLLLLGRAQKTAQPFPRVTLFPGSMVLPDLIDTERLWVRHPGVSTLYGYTLEPDARGLLPIAAQFEFAEPSSGPFLALRDGSFIRSREDDWQRFFPQGKRFNLRGGHPAKPFRALRAHRIDQFFVLYEDALIERLQIQDRLRVVWSHQLDAIPIDLVSAGNTLVLLTSERRGRTLGWWLEVIRADGSETRLDVGDSEVDSFRGDWVKNQLKPRGLAASEQWVALGGPQGLRVWRLNDLSAVPVPEIAAGP